MCKSASQNPRQCSILRYLEPGPADSFLKVQQRQIKLAGMLNGTGGISVSFGKPGEGNGDEDIVLRIKADAPVLRPDEPVPARPVLLCASPGQ
jgi:hypothetical protein